MIIAKILINYNLNIPFCQISNVIGWCQELVGTFLTSKKLFDFNSRK